MMNEDTESGNPDMKMKLKWDKTEKDISHICEISPFYLLGFYLLGYIHEEKFCSTSDQYTGISPYIAVAAGCDHDQVKGYFKTL
jgi:hypothetical protein